MQYEGYMQRLERMRQNRQKEEQVITPTLPERISQWWDALSPEEKHLEYNMDFFVNRFGATRQQIGTALFTLGWQRHRRWVTSKPHSRYWVKT